MNRQNKSYVYIAVGGCIILVGIGIALIPLVTSTASLSRLGISALFSRNKEK